MNVREIYKVTVNQLRMFMVRKLSENSLIFFFFNEYMNRLFYLNLFITEINKKKKLKEMDWSYPK